MADCSWNTVGWKLTTDWGAVTCKLCLGFRRPATESEEPEVEVDDIDERPFDPESFILVRAGEWEALVSELERLRAESALLTAAEPGEMPAMRRGL